MLPGISPALQRLPCILGFAGTMDHHRYRQIFLNVACLLFLCVVDFRPLLIGGFLKLMAFLILAYLLLFVVVNCGNLGRVVVTCLRTLPLSLLTVIVDWRWLERSPTVLLVPNEPSLSPLSQRPPPIFS